MSQVLWRWAFLLVVLTHNLVVKGQHPDCIQNDVSYGNLLQLDSIPGLSLTNCYNLCLKNDDCVVAEVSSANICILQGRMDGKTSETGTTSVLKYCLPNCINIHSGPADYLGSVKVPSINFWDCWALCQVTDYCVAASWLAVSPFECYLTPIWTTSVYEIRLISAPKYCINYDLPFTSPWYQLGSSEYWSHGNISVERTTAVSLCEAEGGHLVTIETSSENSFLKALLGQVTTQMGTFMGMMSPYTSWDTGVTVSFQNWCPSQPDNANEPSPVVFFGETTGFCWDNWNTGSWGGFVCERVLDPTCSVPFNYDYHVDRYYSRHKFSMKYIAAKDHCTFAGGQLAGIWNREKAELLVNQVGASTRFLVGGLTTSSDFTWGSCFDNECDGKIVWASNMTSFGIPSYLTSIRVPFAPAECFVMRSNFNLIGLNASMCDAHRFRFVCEIQCAPSCPDPPTPGSNMILDWTTSDSARLS